jgi:hypothetical protein
MHGHGHHDCQDGDCHDGDCHDGDCHDGTCHKCEHHVRTRKYLIVKIRKEEECVNKCHVEERAEEPKCKESHHHKASCADGSCLPPPSGEVITAPAALPAPPAPPVAEKIQAPKGK